MGSNDVPKPIEIDTLFVDSQVVAPFCLSWSQDNKISIIVEGGVYVFELCPTPVGDQSSIHFLKSWIPASASLPLTNAVIDDKNGAFLWSLKRKEVFEVSLDSTLSCAFQKNSAGTTAHLVQCEFSPLICNKSYISCLTNNGLVDIYKSDFNKWFPVINITHLWISHCRSGNVIKDIDFNNFKSKMFQFKITIVKWFEKPEVMFVTGHENGEIVLWNVGTSNGGTLAMSVRHCLDVGGKPCALELSADSKACLLFVGTSSGIVKCLAVDLATGDIGQRFNLWKDEDLILPSSIKTKRIAEHLFVLTVKRHILLIQKLEAGSNQVLKTNWKEFQTTIVSFNEYQDDFIVSLQNHEAFVLSIREDVINDVKAVDMGIKPKHIVSYHNYGLAMSQNKAIWLLISSPSVNYDSLKEITHLIFYTTEKKMFKSLSDVTSKDLIEKIVKEFKTTNVNEFFDLLECKKLELLSGNSKFKDSYDFNSNSSPLELKLILWELKLKIFCNSAETGSTVGDLEFAIAQKRAQEMAEKLRHRKSLSELEKKSLDACLAVSKMTQEKREGSFGVCVICGGEAFFESVRISSCSNFHKFPRCCLSLLPCDVVPYAVCMNCDAVALISFVSDTECRCPYCDGLLVPDTKLRLKS